MITFSSRWDCSEGMDTWKGDVVHFNRSKRGFQQINQNVHLQFVVLGFGLGKLIIPLSMLLSPARHVRPWAPRRFRWNRHFLTARTAIVSLMQRVAFFLQQQWNLVYFCWLLWGECWWMFEACSVFCLKYVCVLICWFSWVNLMNVWFASGLFLDILFSKPWSSIPQDHFWDWTSSWSQEQKP